MTLEISILFIAWGIISYLFGYKEGIKDGKEWWLTK